LATKTWYSATLFSSAFSASFRATSRARARRASSASNKAFRSAMNTSSAAFLRAAASANFATVSSEAAGYFKKPQDMVPFTFGHWPTVLVTSYWDETRKLIYINFRVDTTY
jgi:hypothetical protein